MIRSVTLLGMKVFTNIKSKRFIALLIAFLLVAVVASGLIERTRIREIVAKPAPVGTPVPLPVGMSAEERSFYDFVVPRMLKASAEAQVLAELGREKSRNIFELQTRGDRVDRYESEIASFISSHRVPDRFAAPMREFLRGESDLQHAMADSKRGMMTFDWNLVAAQIAVFEKGANTVKSATDQIQATAGQATPESS
jgi:hypothetical protein